MGQPRLPIFFSASPEEFLKFAMSVTSTETELNRGLSSNNFTSKYWMLLIQIQEERLKQARKSSEDTHFTEYARFEKVWAG